MSMINTPDPDKIDLGPMAERIRLVRESIGLSQQEFADRLGYSRRQVVAWEAAANMPPVSLMMAMRLQFDIDPEWVMLGPGLEPVRKLNIEELDRSKRVRRDVEQLIEAAGLKLSQRIVSSLTELILREDPRDEKRARQKMLSTLRALAIEWNR